MKISRPFKLILYATLIVLYAAGALNWALHMWFPVDHGFGPEPTVTEIFSLRVHGLVGMWFLIVFGYLFHSHVFPALQGGRKLKTGYTLLLFVAVLSITTPGLFYLSVDSYRAIAAWIHTYAGLIAAVPFFVHLLLKTEPLRRRKR